MVHLPPELRVRTWTFTTVGSGFPVFGWVANCPSQSNLSAVVSRGASKLCTAFSYRSRFSTCATGSRAAANLHMDRKEGRLPAGVSGFASASSSPNRCSLTMSKALHSFPLQGSVAWWL